ncbi:hypothetical protein AMTRI_Chr07g30760 [Amborella trichopoda]
MGVEEAKAMGGDVAEEKTVIPRTNETPPAPPPQDDSKALAVVEKVADPVPSLDVEKSIGGSIDRDAVLAKVESEKRMSLIRAWEESEKTKAENKCYKKLSSIGSWENSKKAAVEAELRKMEEKLERQKAEYAEKMKNKIALIHKEAEEKRAMTEAKRGEELLKAEETAAKYRATGLAPKKLIGCFGG